MLIKEAMYCSGRAGQPELPRDPEKTQEAISHQEIKTKFGEKFLQVNDPKSKKVIFSTERNIKFSINS